MVARACQPFKRLVDHAFVVDRLDPDCYAQHGAGELPHIIESTTSYLTNEIH